MISPPCLVHSAKSPWHQIFAKALEIGGVIFLSVRIVPEHHRHRGEGLRADQFALFLLDMLAVVGPDIHRHAETGRLDFAAPDRRGRIAEHEAGHDVGAARNRGEMQVLLDVGIDVIEAFGGERRAGRGHHPHRRQIVRLRRMHVGLFQRIDIFRRGAEQRDLLVLRIVEQHVGLRRERRAVPQNQGGAGADAGHQPVPHHPAERGEIEDAIAVAHIALQPMLLQMLQQRAAAAMHDAFRHAGRAGRIKNIDRDG